MFRSLLSRPNLRPFGLTSMRTVGRWMFHQREIRRASCPFKPASCLGESPSSILSKFGKVRLTGFVTATAGAGYVLSNGASLAVGSGLLLGTQLLGMSAIGANQLLEVELDRQMKRTARRPMVIGALTPQQGWCLVTVQGIAGLICLVTLTNAITAILGVLNWFLYVCIYTPLKIRTPLNTWVGAMVGAIPPLMGGTSSLLTLADNTTRVETSRVSLNLSNVVDSTTTPAITPSQLQVSSLDWLNLSNVFPILPESIYPSILLASFLFAWQIPHFMSLAFYCRRDYQKAGFKMLSFCHPWRATVWSLLLTLLMASLTLWPFPQQLLTRPLNGWFLAMSGALNGFMLYHACLFYYNPVVYCRQCFISSYIYLGLMLCHLLSHHLNPFG